MTTSNLIVEKLTKAADIVVRAVRGNLRSGDYPDEIGKGIEIESAKVRKGQGSISILFTAPMSAAFERGSGVHGPDGSTYRIEPKEAGAGALAFEWDKTPRGPGEKFIGKVPVEGDERLMFRYVDHPGIEARPYIRPALDDKKKDILETLKTPASLAKIIVRDGRPKKTVIK